MQLVYKTAQRRVFIHDLVKIRLHQRPHSRRTGDGDRNSRIRHARGQSEADRLLVIIGRGQGKDSKVQGSVPFRDEDSQWLRTNTASNWLDLGGLSTARRSSTSFIQRR